MTRQEAGEIVAILKAAFPRQPIEPETVRVYATFLEDLDVAIATNAVRQLVGRSRFFPTIAEVREAVAEATLGLPGEVEAWERINQHAFHQPTTTPCGDCGSSGFVDIEADEICDTCRGEGRTTDRPPALHPVMQRALDYVGGAFAIRSAENMGVLRAQFRDAYRELRVQSVRRVALDPLEPAAARTPIERLADVPALPAPELRSMT